MAWGKAVADPRDADKAEERRRELAYRAKIDALKADVTARLVRPRG